MSALIALLSGRRPALILATTTAVCVAGVLWLWVDRAVERGIDTIAGAE